MDNEKGQILILALTFMVVLIYLSGALLGFVGQNVLGTRASLAREQALQLAEAGMEKALWQLNQTAGAYTGELGSVLGANTGEFDVIINTIMGSRREIVVTGYVPTKVNPRVTRQVKAEVAIGTSSVKFNYGVQVGAGGLEMDQGSRVNGNIYSNGPVEGANNARITGDAISAGVSGQISKDLQIDGSAYAHTIEDDVSIGGSAFGQVMDDITVGGNVFTNSISNCTIGGNVFYTTISSCSVGGAQNSGYPGEPDPDVLDFPIVDQQITDWKNEAVAGGIINGDYVLDDRGSASLGPKKITGDLIIDNNSQLTLTGTLWVVGNVDFDNGASVQLDSGYGSLSGVILNDGWIHMKNNGTFSGSGTAGSYLMFFNTNACLGSSGSNCTHHSSAIDLHNNATGAIVYAQNGLIHLHNNVAVTELTGYKIFMDNNAVVTYDSGLANANFTAGPGGSWEIVRGTWRITQ